MTKVNTFFQAYDSRFNDNWNLVEVLDTAAEALREQQRVCTPGLERAKVVAFLESSGFPAANASTYVDFVAHGSCQSLDCDGFVEFFRTNSFEDWRSNVANASESLDGITLFPVGFDAGTGAVFCLERTHGSAQPRVSVIDQGRSVSGVFSSFDAMLQVLTRVLSSRTVLYVERGAEPDQAQRALVRELTNLDPDGFGAVGWPHWYQRMVGGENW